VSGAPEAVRRLAYDEVYLLPGAVERKPAGAPDFDELLATVSPHERTRLYQIAARRLAFQVLYELDAGGVRDADPFVRRTLAQVEDLGPIALEEVSALTVGAFDARKEADREFTRLAPEWPTHRLAAVDRAILRLAHHEMSVGRTPPKVALSEAVELAKHFSTEKSPAFINGLLDRILNRPAPAPAPAVPAAPEASASHAPTDASDAPTGDAPAQAPTSS